MRAPATRRRHLPPARRPGIREDERGFALAFALLALVGITVLGVGGFLLTSSEYGVSLNHGATVHAFHSASAGLEHSIGTSRGVPEDTVAVPLAASDSASVSFRSLLRPDTLRRLYLITSRGFRPEVGGRAVRTVGTLALLDLGSIAVPGALATGVPLHKNGGSGEISGYDGATTADCPEGAQPARAGLIVPPGGYSQTSGDTVPAGDPPILEQDPLETLEATGIDWSGIVAGTALSPDYQIPGDPWPDFGSLGPDEWPVVYVDSAHMELAPGHSGQGTLMVRGDVTMNGSFHWDGLLLVGGSITSDGNQIIHGGTVSALNLLLGEAVPDNDLGNGTKTFRFHSCNLLAATARLASLAIKPGTWFERL